MSYEQKQRNNNNIKNIIIWILNWLGLKYYVVIKKLNCYNDITWPSWRTGTTVVGSPLGRIHYYVLISLALAPSLNTEVSSTTPHVRWLPRSLRKIGRKWEIISAYPAIWGIQREADLQMSFRKSCFVLNYDL